MGRKGKSMDKTTKKPRKKAVKFKVVGWTAKQVRDDHRRIAAAHINAALDDCLKQHGKKL